MKFVQGNEEYVDMDLFGVEDARRHAVERKQLLVKFLV